MIRRSLVSVFCAALALTAAASAKPAAPIAQTFPSLSGTYSCADGTGHARPAVWSSALGGSWIAASNGVVENQVAHDASAHVYRVTSIDNQGGVMLFQAPDTSATHIVFKEVYPSHADTTIYQHVSDTKYTLDYSGTSHGKAFHVSETCTKK